MDLTAAAAPPRKDAAPPRKDGPSALDLKRLARELAPRTSGSADHAASAAHEWVPSHSLPSSDASADTFARFEKAVIRTGESAADAAAKKLARLEKMLRAQEAELCEREAERAEQAEVIRKLRAENMAMHDFLADYGMRWIGTDGLCQGASPPSCPSGARGGSRAGSRPASGGGGAAAASAAASASAGPVFGRRATASAAPAAAPKAPAAATRAGGVPPSAVRQSGTPAASALPSAGLPAAPSMDKVRAAVLELNDLAGAGGAVVLRPGGSHGLETPSLPLVFWKDGLQVDRGGLRSYGAPDSAAFLRDLLDGFFPYELKHAFPDGVCFGVTDRTARRFAEGEPKEWGCGRVLDSPGDSRVAHFGVLAPRDDASAAAGAAGAAHERSEREARAAALARAAEARMRNDPSPSSE